MLKPFQSSLAPPSTPQLEMDSPALRPRIPFRFAGCPKMMSVLSTGIVAQVEAAFVTVYERDGSEVEGDAVGLSAYMMQDCQPVTVKHRASAAFGAA